jgi:hypothetical protein
MEGADISQPLDQPAVTHAIEPPPAQEAVDVAPKPREAYSLALRPRYRVTGTERYKSCTPAGRELIKIPLTFKKEASVDASQVENLQALFDTTDLGTPTGDIFVPSALPAYWTSDTVTLETVKKGSTFGDADATMDTIATLIPAAGTYDVANGWWTGDVILSRPREAINFHYELNIADKAVVDGVIRITPPIPVTIQHPVDLLTAFKWKVLTATNAEEFFQPGTESGQSEEGDNNAGVEFLNSDIHDLLENNSDLFGKFEAYSINNATIQLTDASNWLLASGQIYSAYVADPERNAALTTKDVGKTAWFAPRQANIKMFGAGHNHTWVLPIQDVQYFTLYESSYEKRFVSPGNLAIGLISRPRDAFKFAVTLSADVTYYVQSSRSTQPAVGRTVEIQLPKSIDVELTARDRFFPVHAEFGWNVPDGYYLPLQSVGLSVPLPNNMVINTTLGRITVQGDKATFRVSTLENFDIRFIERVQSTVGVSSNPGFFYYIPFSA